MDKGERDNPAKNVKNQFIYNHSRPTSGNLLPLSSMFLYRRLSTYFRRVTGKHVDIQWHSLGSNFPHSVESRVSEFWISKGTLDWNESMGFIFTMHREPFLCVFVVDVTKANALLTASQEHDVAPYNAKPEQYVKWCFNKDSRGQTNRHSHLIILCEALECYRLFALHKDTSVFMHMFRKKRERKQNYEYYMHCRVSSGAHNIFAVMVKV